jgi:hypothetical protein
MGPIAWGFVAWGQGGGAWSRRPLSGLLPFLSKCLSQLLPAPLTPLKPLTPPPQENIDMMSEYLPLDRFKAVYVVDLCHSLCEQAKLKVKAKGWKNVHVVEGDACAFAPPGGQTADLVTFSYSLSSAFSWDWADGGEGGGNRRVERRRPLFTHSNRNRL